jgi:iron complex transport system substrate-binding protein
MSRLPILPHLLFLIHVFQAMLPASALGQPLRVASMNLCSDQLLLLLSPREQIVSLSYLAADPAWSPVAAQVSGLHLNRGLAEEILPRQPDLVLSGQFSASLANNLLERLGIPVLRLGIAATPEDIHAQIQLVAEQLGQEAQASQIITGMQVQLAAHLDQLQPWLQGKTALFYSSNGFTYGAGTLQDAFIRSLGMFNVASDLNGPVQLGLEHLLRSEPDILFINPPSRLDQQLAHPLLDHSALRSLALRMQRIEIPDRLFECASPVYLQAYAELERQL